MKLRCYLGFLLRVHRADCEHCNTPNTWGREIRKRLEELNSRMSPLSLNDRDHEEAVRVFESKPCEVVADPPISLMQRKKIV